MILKKLSFSFAKKFLFPARTGYCLPERRKIRQLGPKPLQDDANVRQLAANNQQDTPNIKQGGTITLQDRSKSNRSLRN